MVTRRRALKQLGLMAGGGFIGNSFLDWEAVRRIPAQKAPSRLWAVDAGQVRVTPGPWTTLPAMKSGVRLENLYLRMPDGVRLNAFLYLPANLSRSEKIPGLLNTMPYRYEPRNDSHLARNEYASIFVDVRGTGGSEGIPTDEYSREEHQDTFQVIDWLSKQPWCNGNIGMYGASYGAFNSVWVAAALKPPALKAIYALCGTDNRYTDDIHFPGGAMLMVDNSWALAMLTMNCMPAAPDFEMNSKQSLDRWETPSWFQGYLHHQLDGPYWRHGSLAPDYERLTIPTFLIGGYLDIYQNFVPRIMKNATGAVTKGILGPWHHTLEEPGPKIDLEGKLMLDWFDQWLKEKETGILKEPQVSFYMPRWQRQSFRYTGDIPGEWRYLNDWPDTVFKPGERLFLRPDPEHPAAKALAMEPAPGQGGQLTDQAGLASALKLRYYPGTGGSGQSFGPTSAEGYYGIDHRAEDVWGLSFDTPPLQGSVEILGFTKARLFVSSTAPVAIWIVRLCDIAPDGTSYLVGRGYLNGTHRRSHTNPEPLVSGEIYKIEVEMMCTGYKFESGHRMRIVVTNADFPVLWPSPYKMVTTLYTGGDRASHIELPVLPKLSYLSGTIPPMDESLPRLPRPADEDSKSVFQMNRDFDRGVTTAKLNVLFNKITCQVKDDDPASASLETQGASSAEAGKRRIEVRSDGSLQSTEDSFILNMKVDLLENDKVVRSREWKDKIKRELV